MGGREREPEPSEITQEDSGWGWGLQECTGRGPRLCHMGEGKGVLTGGMDPRGPLAHIHPVNPQSLAWGSETAQCLAHGRHSAVIHGVSAPRMAVMVGAEGMGVFPQLLSPGPGPESWRPQFKSVGLYRSPLCLSTYFPPGFKGSPRPCSGSLRKLELERLRGASPLLGGGGHIHGHIGSISLFSTQPPSTPGLRTREGKEFSQNHTAS